MVPDFVAEEQADLPQAVNRKKAEGGAGRFETV